MQNRFVLYRRGKVFYCEDRLTGKQESLRTKDKGEADALLLARREANRQPFLNLRIAQTYLSATDPQIVKRTTAPHKRVFFTTAKWPVGELMVA